MHRTFITSMAALALAATAQATDLPPVPATPNAAASQLLQKHLSAFLRGDVDAVVSDYASDAVFIAPEGTYHGPRQIRGFFENLMRQFPPGASTLALDRTEFSGDLVYFVWHGETPTLHVPFAMDTMILREGRIAKQTFAGVMGPVGR